MKIIQVSASSDTVVIDGVVWPAEDLVFGDSGTVVRKYADIAEAIGNGEPPFLGAWLDGQRLYDVEIRFDDTVVGVIPPRDVITEDCYEQIEAEFERLRQREPKE